MSNNLQIYHQLANHTAQKITSSYQSWTDFLTTAARLYKYPYHEQLMIYAQRPEATACASYDLWNQKMGRYIRRRAQRIALIDSTGDTPKLKYVFDIADTGVRKHSRSPYIWKYREEHREAIFSALEEQFGISSDGDFAEQLHQISGVKVAEYWLAHQQDILDIVDGSYLEGYPDEKAYAQINASALESIAPEETRALSNETEAVYPGEKTGLPYDIVVERLHIEEPEPALLTVNEKPLHLTPEEASEAEHRDTLRGSAQNFHITDNNLGEGGPKAKYQANIAAITRQLLRLR